MDSASARVFPFTAPVISDAEALEMAQPFPSKLTSAMRLPSSLTQTVSSSPHIGL